MLLALHQDPAEDTARATSGQGPKFASGPSPLELLATGSVTVQPRRWSSAASCSTGKWRSSCSCADSFADGTTARRVPWSSLPCSRAMKAAASSAGELARCLTLGKPHRSTRVAEVGMAGVVEKGEKFSYLARRRGWA